MHVRQDAPRTKVETCENPHRPALLEQLQKAGTEMLSIHVRINRAERLLRMLEQDAPMLAVRVAELTPERQQSAKSYAARLTAHAKAELEKLRLEVCAWDSNDPTPEAAD